MKKSRVVALTIGLALALTASGSAAFATSGGSQTTASPCCRPAV